MPGTLSSTVKRPNLPSSHQGVSARTVMAPRTMTLTLHFIVRRSTSLEVLYIASVVSSTTAPKRLLEAVCEWRNVGE